MTDPGATDDRLIDKLAVEIQERGLSPFSVASYIRHLRIFLRWAQAEGEVPGKVEMKSPKPLKRDLSRSDPDRAGGQGDGGPGFQPGTS